MAQKIDKTENAIEKSVEKINKNIENIQVTLSAHSESLARLEERTKHINKA